MAVLVVYESKQDRTKEVANAIADAAADRDFPTLIRSVDETTSTHIDSASVVIAGCTTPGDVPFGGKPTQRIAAWINNLDSLEGKPVGVYCAYRFFPHTFADTTTRVSETLDKLGGRFEFRGGRVVASQGINLREMNKGASQLIDQLQDHITDN